MIEAVECIWSERVDLHARNSSGEQALHIDRFEDNTYKFTLTGMYRDEAIQIDFNELSADEFRDAIAKLYKLTKLDNNKTKRKINENV